MCILQSSFRHHTEVSNLAVSNISQVAAAEGKDLQQNAWRLVKLQCLIRNIYENRYICSNVIGGGATNRASVALQGSVPWSTCQVATLVTAVSLCASCCLQGCMPSDS
jgi:hypothetical protein